MVEIHDKILHPQRRALAHGGGLRRLKMRIGEGGLRLVLLGKIRKRGNGAEKQAANAQERVTLQNDVGIIPYKAARRDEVDDGLCLRAGKPEGVDMRHDVVPDLTLARGGGGIVDVVKMRAHLVKLLVRYVETELLLALGEGEPESSPRGKLAVIGEYLLHLPPRVALAERIFIYLRHCSHSTVTDFARFLGLSMSQPFAFAT